MVFCRIRKESRRTDDQEVKIKQHLMNKLMKDDRRLAWMGELASIQALHFYILSQPGYNIVSSADE